MMVEYSFAEEIEDVKQDVAYDDEGTVRRDIFLLNF